MTGLGWSSAAVAAIAELVAARSGLAFPPARMASAEAAIRRAGARAAYADVAAYRDALCDGRAALDDLLGELTVGETYFFRDPGQFDVIARDVVPEIRRRRGMDHTVRVWSAGCASGEEAYSLAILFREAGLGDRLWLVATDLSSAAIAKARRGVYGRWSLRGQGEARAGRYLVPVEDGYQLDADVRTAVRLAPLNLVDALRPAVARGISDMDLVLCRNVLIYLDPAAIRRVAGHLFAALAEGGWLVTGPSDPPLGDAAPFECITTDAGIVYRRPCATCGTGTRATIGRPAADGPPAPSYARAAVAEEPLATPTCETVPAVTLADRIDEIRAAADRDAEGAARACADAVAAHPLSAELRYLWAVLLLGGGREREALDQLRRVLYLDRSLAVAHFTLAVVLESRGDRDGALRAYRNAHEVGALRPADELLAWADGASAGDLVRAAAAEVTRLELGAAAGGAP